MWHRSDVCVSCRPRPRPRSLSKGSVEIWKETCACVCAVNKGSKHNNEHWPLWSSVIITSLNYPSSKWLQHKFTATQKNPKNLFCKTSHDNDVNLEIFRLVPPGPNPNLGGVLIANDQSDTAVSPQHLFIQKLAWGWQEAANKSRCVPKQPIVDKSSSLQKQF